MIINVIEATNKIILVIIIPFFRKSINEYFTLLVFNILSHIIPAKAPTGVKIAPRLEPIIVA